MVEMFSNYSRKISIKLDNMAVRGLAKSEGIPWLPCHVLCRKFNL